MEECRGPAAVTDEAGGGKSRWAPPPETEKEKHEIVAALRTSMAMARIGPPRRPRPSPSVDDPAGRPGELKQRPGKESQSRSRSSPARFSH